MMSKSVSFMDDENLMIAGGGGGRGGRSLGRRLKRNEDEDDDDASIASFGGSSDMSNQQYYRKRSSFSDNSKSSRGSRRSSSRNQQPINNCSTHTNKESEDLSSDLSDDGDSKTARTMRTVKTLRIPEGNVTIIYTDVQSSTSMWEADPLAMKRATEIHDSIIRKCYAEHGGYEITTEGDSFNLAFQHPADAIGFALRAQLSLYRANWPEGILTHPDGCDKEKMKFRGFRVRMGMHHGPTEVNVHETTGRTTYQGEAVDIAKAIEKMSHGGQVLTTVETWRAVSGMAEQFLGSPQVMDCGEHLLYDMKKEKVDTPSMTKRIVSKRIVQLVPNSLSYDFFAARGGQVVDGKDGKAPPKVCGRVFPPLLSHGQLSTSFLNAPYIGNRVALVFMFTDKMESLVDIDRKKNYKILAKYVRSHLMRLSPPGYECQEDRGSWMLAFDSIENGIKFGLDLREDVTLNANLSGNINKERVFRIGIHWGPFVSMGPHTVSGHADYFGPIGEFFSQKIVPMVYLLQRVFIYYHRSLLIFAC
jgi:class 3 adenylate cyclase